MMKNYIFFLFIWLVAGFYPPRAFARQYQYPKILGAEQGASSSIISNAIVQDRKGFIWIGTENGLSRFDGHSFVVYKAKENESNCIAGNIITSLYIDSTGRLWVASINGLQYYDEEEDNFKSDPRLSHPLLERNQVKALFEDSRQNLWIGIEDRGVLRYSLQTGEFNMYFSGNDGKKVNGKSVRCIVEDKGGNIWFATIDKGITVYIPTEDRFIYYNEANSGLPVDAVLSIVDLADNNLLISTIGHGIYILDRSTDQISPVGMNRITSFCMLRLQDNSVLVGTDGNGLWHIDRTGRHVTRHTAIPYEMHQVTTSKMHSLLEDKNGNLWIGMYNEGMCYIRRQPTGFTAYKSRFNQPNSLSYGQVTGITTDHSNNIWFATDGGGLNFYDRKTGNYTHFSSSANIPGSLPDDAVVSVFCDSEGTIWAGSYTGGLSKYNPETNRFYSYRYTGASNGLPGNYVKSIVEDTAGNLWLGLDGGGISYFDTKTEIFTNYSIADGLISNYVTNLFLSSGGKLWIGTHKGLCVFDMEQKVFKIYEEDFNYNSRSIYSIVEDTDKIIWVGSSQGLYRYAKEKNSFQEEKLPLTSYEQLIINSIIPYKNRLWLTTNQGIVCYEPKTRQILLSIRNSDLEGISFIRSACYISPDNELFFGGGSGCFSFYPDSLDFSGYLPKTYLTGLRISNRPVRVGDVYNGRKILPKALDRTDAITLKYDENNISFDFAVPGSLLPASMQYVCRMEGVDKEWRYFDAGQTNVTYANLAHGKYVFQVYASPVPEQQNSPVTSLSIRILPPVWLTVWAKLLYLLLGIGIFFLIFWFIYIRMKYKNELALEKLKAKEQEELNRNKMQFFTNISHEFRTPLTLIISPLKDIYDREQDKSKLHLFSLVLRNANRLLHLINQILDLRKVEYGHIEIHIHPIRLDLFINNLAELFSDILEKKHISLIVNCEPRETTVWYDPEWLEKCLYNLLSNALKFTPDHGTITITLSEPDSQWFTLCVEDTGCGIEENDIPYLFERFYQGDTSRTSGSGIGLHLVKTIVELHKGKISVESRIGKGSKFTIQLLKGKEHFEATSVNLTPWTPDEGTPALPIKEDLQDNPTREETLKEPQARKKNKPSLLLVEDENDMRMYIYESLLPNYQVVTAKDGREALLKLRDFEPDLIISDVMMPEMNGTEFCRIVKENMDTCHIPVILLTANKDIDQQLEGLETGADSYIIKPFHMDYLQIRIRKLLEMRKKMQLRADKLLTISPQPTELAHPDEVLLNNCIEYIRENMQDTDLSVEKIAKELYVSRTHLHRKIKIQTGNSPVELIKILRMKQAAHLIEEGNATIAEIAYRVGYNSPSYFSRSFTTYFGVSPTLYTQTEQPEKKQQNKNAP